MRPYFPVATHKFVVLSLCTLTLYELYWSYHNWKRIRDRHHEDLSPFWRAFFAPIWTFSLFPRIRGDAKHAGIPVGWSPRALAVLVLVLNISWRLPDPWWLISLGSFVAFIPVVQTIGEINRSSAGAEPLNDSYSAANVVTIVLGGLILLLAVVGTFLPDPYP